jgi:hypothetical protein
VKSTVTLGAALLLLVACHKDRDAEGPVERAGKGVDRAATKTGDAFHRAAVKTDEAAHKAVRATGEAFEKAGKKLKSAPRATQTPTEPKPKPADSP